MQYDSKISFGNLVTMAVVAAGVIASYAVMQYQVTNLGTQLTTVKSDANDRTVRFENLTGGYEARIRAIEIAQASQSADLRSIQSGINEIKDQLRTITGPGFVKAPPIR